MEEGNTQVKSPDSRVSVWCAPASTSLCWLYNRGQIKAGKKVELQGLISCMHRAWKGQRDRLGPGRGRVSRETTSGWGIKGHVTSG